MVQLHSGCLVCLFFTCSCLQHISKRQNNLQTAQIPIKSGQRKKHKKIRGEQFKMFLFFFNKVQNLNDGQKSVVIKYYIVTVTPREQQLHEQRENIVVLDGGYSNNRSKTKRHITDPFHSSRGRNRKCVLLVHKIKTWSQAGSENEKSLIWWI